MRRGLDQQVEKMVLFAHFGTLLLELCDHPVEYFDQLVRFAVADRAQAARKILLPEQVDSAEKQLIRPYEFSVQPDEQQQYNQGPGFCTPEQQRLFGQRKHPECGRRTGSRDC